MQLRLCFTATSRGWLESFKLKKKKKEREHDLSEHN